MFGKGCEGITESQRTVLITSYGVSENELKQEQKVDVNIRKLRSGIVVNKKMFLLPPLREFIRSGR